MLLQFQDHGKAAGVMPLEHIPVEVILGARTSIDGAVNERAHKDSSLARQETPPHCSGCRSASHRGMAVIQPFWRLQGSLKTCDLRKSGATNLGLRLVGLHQLAGGLRDSQYQCRLQGVLRSSLELPSLVEAKRR